MGQALARQLVAAGCNVAMWDLSAEAMAESGRLCETEKSLQGLRITARVSPTFGRSIVGVTKSSSSTPPTVAISWSTMPASEVMASADLSGGAHAVEEVLDLLLEAYADFR